MRHLSWKIVKWPAKGEFRISRSALTEFVTVQLTIEEAGFLGRAECRPYGRYMETAESVIDQIKKMEPAISNGLSKNELRALMPAGAARNAIDCALWDLESKSSGKRFWDLADLPSPRPRETAFTLSIDTPEAMSRAAKAAKNHKFLKMKIGGNGGTQAVEAVIAARPDARLIVDANEAINGPDLEMLRNIDGSERIAMIEQPFPSSQDRNGLFEPGIRPIICADESLHTTKDLFPLWAAGYRAVNIKLDKTGGLTEALLLMRQAKEMGFKIMAGCMVGSSLAMAPMMMLESFADFIDLDGPLLLSDDFQPSLTYKGGKIFPPSKKLWG